MTFIFLLLFAFLVLCYNVFSWGFVVSKLYGWFVLSAIPSLPHYNYMVFVGFILFLNAIIRHQSPSIKDEYVDKASGWTYLFLAPWITLIFAWAVHSIWF